MEQLDASRTLVNALIEPSGTPGEVYISTGPNSSDFKEKISCEMAANMLAEIGVDSVKFYPINGDKRLKLRMSIKLSKHVLITVLKRLSRTYIPH
ncbi:Protein of uncharacterised function (DUF1341) [Mycobacteroides abscessus subsp. abscessus]|nr:Protein of uncharacterised function (DUF1341) [Mycobacteroides abscessus subsp. abscessus]